MKLNFRVKGISNEIKQRILVLAVIFVAAVVFFEVVLNYESQNKEKEMESAVLPTVTMMAFDTQINELHGYKTQMNACYMRDAIVPLNAERELPLQVHTGGYPVTGMSYEIRSLDTERKIAETKVKQYQADGDELSATLKIENLVEIGEEYLFILKLETEEDPLYYYTRIMLPVDCHERESLEFAKYFHDMALSDNYSQLASYLEPSPDVNPDTLAQVSIASSMDQIGWDGFDGNVVGEPIIEMKDINTSYVVLEFYFQMKRDNGDGKSEYYNVKEYFKVRYAPERMYLLDYNRNTEQIVDFGTLAADGNKLPLGVAGDDLHYLSNETGTVVSFVQGGELFQYNQNTGKLTRIFSFLGDDIHDSRNYYGEHKILILNIDESGTMDFAVYGYMNNGSHEGQCGIDLYHYDSTRQQTVEQVFVATTDSYQILNANFSNLLYETLDGCFYLMVGGTLVEVDLNTLKTKEVLRGLSDGQYAVSDSGRHIAWIEEDGMAKTVSVMDLETDTTREINAEKGELLKPLAFMEEDLVCGTAGESDIGYDAAGTVVYPMYRLYIMDSSRDFSVVKNYQKDGFYVTAAEKENYTLRLERMQKQGNIYVDASGDTIKNSSGEKNKAVSVVRKAHEALGEVTFLVMAELEEDVKPPKTSAAIAGFVSADADKSIAVTTEETQEKYFVYVGSWVALATGDLSKAIASADENLGIVINNKQQYIWKRGRKAYQNPLKNSNPSAQDANANASARCISAMLVREGQNVEVHQLLEQGDTPIRVLQNTLKDSATVLDLTGCTLTQVLYYVSQGSPVYVRTGEEDAALIVGYDAANVILYDPGQRAVRKMGLMDATALFKSRGNVFISYIRNE